MIIKISDDSGFMGIIDPSAYKAFVNKDWTFDQLLAHFRNQFKEQTLLLWATSDENVWTVLVSSESKNIKGDDEIFGSIIVTNNQLLLVNYETLTMAAQFSDIKLPEKIYESCIIPVNNGLYKVKISRFTKPTKIADNNKIIDFYIELIQSEEKEAIWDRIAWYDNL